MVFLMRKDSQIDVQRFSHPCEWNSEKGRAAYDHEVHAEANIIVGANGQWRLCVECAKLSNFVRYRVRKMIT